MANPRIEVDIVAVVDGLKKGFGESVGIIGKLQEKALELEKDLRNATSLPEIAGLNSKLAQTKAALTQLKTTGIEPLTKATSNYNAVGIDFARVIQDAPFGIIGVGNNIQQLAQSFSSLGKAGDSTGTKFKLALGQIFSSGNLLILGVSALTTALTFLSQNGFFKSEDAVKSLADELDKYKKTLGETAQAQLEAAANADKEIIKIQSLRGVIENETLSREKRLAAVKKLRDEAPSIFKNLSDEQILSGKVGDSYARLTQILLARATASSGINKIVALADEERIILEKNASTLAQIAQFEQKAANFRAQGQQELVTVNENQIKFLKAQNPEIQRLAEIEKERVKLTSLVNENLSFSVDYSDKKVKSAKDLNKEKLKGLSLEEDSIRNVEFGNQLQEEAKKKLQSLLPELENVKNKFADINIDVAPVFEIPDIDDSSLTGFVLRLADFNAQVAGVIENGAQQTIGDFAFAIGDAIGSGGNVLKAGGAALLGGIAGILNQLGQLAIGAGLAVEGIKKALQTLNPAVAIGAGVALVALAGFVSSKAKSLGGGVRGGGGGGSSVGGSGVGGGSSFVGGAQGGIFASQRDLNGELVVRGQDLVYVFGQASDRINKG